MKPPIYPPLPSGNAAQRFMHRARMFRNAALGMPDIRNGEPFWPKYALLTHSIELSLKGFALYSVAIGKPKVKEPKHHDLKGWYQLAIHYGITYDGVTARNIELLNELHENHFTRYPTTQSARVPDASVIADETVDSLIAILTEHINPR